jgi:hypothetical protein
VKKPKSSSKDSTTDKIFTREMYKTLSAKQTMALKKQGWRDAQPVTDWKAAWQQGVDAQGYAYKAPGFQPSMQISPQAGDTYIAGMQNLPDPEVAKLQADPEMQQMAQQMGVSVNDLLLFREMMLDRFVDRYQDPE